MIITLTKLGRNCQVVFYNTGNGNTQTFQEDSANIECTYNVLNDVVSVAIKGRTQATTTSIVDNDVLYINTGIGDILIKTYSDFLINYALLFLNAGGTGGGTNPTTYIIPVNNGGVFIDSSLQYDWGIGILSTFNNFFSVQSGFNLNFAQKSYSIGDLFNNISGTTLLVDDTNFIINTKWGGNDIGLYLNFNYQLFQLGDFNYSANGGYISFDNNSGVFSVFWANIENGLSLNFNTSIYLFGDFYGTIGDFRLKIDSNLGRYNLSSMPAYADNAAALAAGLVVGDLYRHDGLLESQDQLRIVH